MDFLEKDLEQIIFETDKDKLNEGGLEFFDSRSNILRQVDLGAYGIADLIEYKVDRIKNNWVPSKDHCYLYTISINIIELKKDVIGIDSLYQLSRYKTGVKRIIDNFNNGHIEYIINGVLIGKKFEKNDFILLYNFLNDCNIYTYSYNFDGIKFDLISKEWSIEDKSLLWKSKEFLSKINNIKYLKQSAMNRVRGISEPVLSDF